MIIARYFFYCSLFGILSRTTAKLSARSMQFCTMNLRGGAHGRRPSSIFRSSLSLRKRRSTTFYSTSVTNIRRLLTTNPDSEIALFHTAVILHCIFSASLTSSGKHVLKFLEISNWVIFLGWQIVRFSENKELSNWMVSTFTFNPDYKSRRSRPLCMIAAACSQMDFAHLAGNMAAMSTFCPMAIKALGYSGFAQLYSGGSLASKLFYCIWPTISSEFGIDEDRGVPTLGASGAISAVIGFVCLCFREVIIETPVPAWLQSSIPHRTWKIPLGLAGVMWTCADIWGLSKLEAVLFQNKAGHVSQNVNYAGHLGGTTFGITFYFIFKLSQLHNWRVIFAPIQKSVSFLQKASRFIRSQLLKFYLLLIPDSFLENELRERLTRRSRLRSR